jgi:hypothetical protein
MMSRDLQEDKSLMPKLQAVIRGKGNRPYILYFVVLISMHMKLPALREFLRVGTASKRDADNKSVAPSQPTLDSR